MERQGDTLGGTGVHQTGDERRLGFVEHILQMAPECPAHCAVDWNHQMVRVEEAGQRERGGQPFMNICRQRGVSWSKV